MYINLQPDAVGIDLPLEELTPLAARHGYGGIDLPLSRIGEGRETLSLEQIEEAMASAGLEFGSFGAPWDYAGERAVYEQRMDELSRWLPIARRLGCDRGVSGRGPAATTSSTRRTSSSTSSAWRRWRG